MMAACGDPPHSSSGVVARVIDGDTVDVRFGDQTERVRLIGINTPELGYDGDQDECWANESSLALRDALPVGAEIRVVRDTVARDHYGRLLGYLFTADGRFINGDLVMNGHARVLSIPPNTAFALDIQRAENAARRSNLGLWRACES